MNAAPADRLGSRLKLGIVIPSTNTSVQPELDDLRPRGVTNHIARIMVSEQSQTTDSEQVQVLDNIQPDLLPAIDRVMTAGPARLIMGMSLPTFWGGMADSNALKAKLEEHAGVPVTMGSHACLAALACLGPPNRLGILSPYQPIGNNHVANFFREAGYEVLATHSFASPSMRSIATTDEQHFIDALRRLADTGADILLQAGTNLAMIDLVAEAERWLGRPVIAINAATYWHALRQHGIEDRIHGYGRLLEAF